MISRLLANIYLHYVFDLWAERWRRREAAGDMIIVRFADTPCTLRSRKFISIPRQERDEIRHGFQQHILVDVLCSAAFP